MLRSSPLVLLALLSALASSRPAGQTVAARSDAALPTPAQSWARLARTLPPFTYDRVKDEIVRSDTDPRQRLRRIEVKFYSQEIDGKKWGHPAVIYMPADPAAYTAPARRGKVVIVGQRSIDDLATGPWRSSYLGQLRRADRRPHRLPDDGASRAGRIRRD